MSVFLSISRDLFKNWLLAPIHEDHSEKLRAGIWGKKLGLKTCVWHKSAEMYCSFHFICTVIYKTF